MPLLQGGGISFCNDSSSVVIDLGHPWDWPCELKSLPRQCGLEPDFYNSPGNQVLHGEWCTSYFCCLHEDCGMKDPCVLQFFPLRLNLS
mmetsp:Transcript_22886/g.44651  ORF Transcript_22886/g.44651 Transcript_22886/m.44651 type:complete len:89 (-) Transcript_22886:240-506(-)